MLTCSFSLAEYALNAVNQGITALGIKGRLSYPSKVT